MNEEEKRHQIVYCTLFVLTFLLLMFGDQIALHFIKEEPNHNDRVFGSGDTPKEYKIDFLEELTLEEVKEKISNKETFILFSSRDSCMICEKSLPAIKELKENYDAVYYLNREKYEDTSILGDLDKRLQMNLVYTPYFMYFKDGILDTEKTGKITSNDVQKLLLNL